VLNKYARAFFTRVFTPIARVLVRAGVSPDVITLIGTAGVIGGALGFYPRGEFFWGTVIITVFVFFDMFDGAVARVTGKTSRFGAFLDSNMDRVSDAAIFSGLILRYAGGDHGDLLIVALALFCLASGALVSYARARAEGIGVGATVGIAERAERLIIVLVGTGLTGLPGYHVPYVLAIALWLLVAASTITVVQRLATVRAQSKALQATEA